MKRLIYLLLMILVFGCKNPLNPELYNYGHEFELQLGEAVTLKADKVSVEFVDVLEDSRCPSNVTCVWAGNGEVLIRFSDKNVQLNTYLEPHGVSILNTNIQLLSLNPYPEYPRQFEKKDYRVRLLITKN